MAWESVRLTACAIAVHGTLTPYLFPSTHVTRSLNLPLLRFRLCCFHLLRQSSLSSRVRGFTAATTGSRSAASGRARRGLRRVNEIVHAIGVRGSVHPGSVVEAVVGLIVHDASRRGEEGLDR